MHSETVLMLDNVRDSLVKNPILDSDRLATKVLNHMSYFQSASEQKNFEVIKHTVISKIFRELGVSSLELHYTFDTTVFGQMYEYFYWKFEIEGDDCVYKTMKDDIDRKVAEIQDNNIAYNERPGSLRITSILKQNHHILSVFDYLKQNLPDLNLPDLNDEKALILCAVILFDIENISKKRQYNFLSYQYIGSAANPADRWMSCLMVDATYGKPCVILDKVVSTKPA